MMYTYSVSAKCSAVHGRPWQVVVAVVALTVVMSGQRAQAQPGTVLSHQKISFTQGNGPPLGNDDRFGRSVASLGDLDGDGVGDLAVGAWFDDDGGLDRGAVWILFLNPDGTVNWHQKISSTAGCGPPLGNDDRFGRSLASLGDLDGDGVGDLAVGAPRDDDGGTNRGAVWILFLNPDGTVKSHQKISSTAGGGPRLENGDRFGASVASLGDHDGDGIGDLAVGAMFDDDGGCCDRGAVWMLFLNVDTTGRDPLVTVKSHQKISATQGGFTGTLGVDDRFGASVAFLGDLDGDSVGDLAVGAPNDGDGGNFRGAVWVLFLNTDGTGTVKSHQKISDTEGGFTGTLDNGDIFGISVASLGDLNGDGVGDLAVGAMHDDDGGLDRGAVWILFLNTDGMVKSHQKISDTAGGGPRLDNGDKFGVSAASLGDLDGDRVGDLAVGAQFDDDGGFDRGAVWVLFLDGVPASPADITGPLGVPDGCVDAFDLGAMLGAWCSGVNDPNPPSPPCENCTPANLAVADISGAANVPDGCVDAFDLAKLLAEWCSVAGGNPCGTCGP